MLPQCTFMMSVSVGTRALKWSFQRFHVPRTLLMSHLQIIPWINTEPKWQGRPAHPGEGREPGTLWALEIIHIHPSNSQLINVVLILTAKDINTLSYPEITKCNKLRYWKLFYVNWEKHHWNQSQILEHIYLGQINLPCWQFTFTSIIYIGKKRWFIL